MKKIFFAVFILLAGMMTGLQAQDPVKDMKKAARLLGTYNLDPVGGAAKLDEAIVLAEASIGDPAVAADPTSWQTYGDLYMTLLNNDVIRLIQDPEAGLTDGMAPSKAFRGFQQAASLGIKSYQTKDAIKALSNGIQNIYYMGSVLYQSGKYAEAYAAFKATYDGYALLKQHQEPVNISPEEHEQTLYYSGLCAQQAGMQEEATAVFRQLVANGSAEPAVYEALVYIYKDSDPELSEKYLIEGRAKFPEDVDLLFVEINLCLAKGGDRECLDKLEMAAELQPDNVSIFVTTGQVYERLVNESMTTDPELTKEYFRKAESYYNAAIDKDANSFDAMYSIGALWYNRAAGYSAELNELAGDLTPAGNKKYDAKKAELDDAFAKALPFFIKAELLKPDDINTLIALKEIYARQDKFNLVEVYKQKLEALGK